MFECYGATNNHSPITVLEITLTNNTETANTSLARCAQVHYRPSIFQPRKRLLYSARAIYISPHFPLLILTAKADRSIAPSVRVTRAIVLFISTGLSTQTAPQ